MMQFLPPADGDTLAIALTALAAGMVRGFAGFGGGMILIPVVSALFGPQIGATTILVTDGILTLPQFLRALPECDRRTVIPVASAAVVTVPVGAWLLTAADPTPVRWALAGLVVLLLALVVSGWRYRRAPTVPASLGVGAVAGFLSGFVQLSGPPVMAFWISGPLAPRVVRANAFAFFSLTSVAAAISYALGGVFQRELVPVLVVAMPLYAAGLVLGARLFGRADERVFRATAVLLIAVAVIVSLPALDPFLR